MRVKCRDKNTRRGKTARPDRRSRVVCEASVEGENVLTALAVRSGLGSRPVRSCSRQNAIVACARPRGGGCGRDQFAGSSTHTLTLDLLEHLECSL